MMLIQITANALNQSLDWNTSGLLHQFFIGMMAD
jgi:hypothetical protein